MLTGFPQIIILSHRTSDTKGCDSCNLCSHIHILPRSRCFSSTIYLDSCSLSVVSLTGFHDLHCGHKFHAITKQFPTKSPGGDFIFIPNEYGAKHNVTPSPAVRVGERYNLNCEVLHQKIPPAPLGKTGQIGTTPLVGKANNGNHLKSKSLHHITLNVPGERKSMLKGIGNH
jgi:hypothetical protein